MRFKKGDWVCIDIGFKGIFYVGEDGKEKEDTHWIGPIEIEDDPIFEYVGILDQPDFKVVAEQVRFKSWFIKTNDFYKPYQIIRDDNTRYATERDFEEKIEYLKKNIVESEQYLEKYNCGFQKWRGK